jgi:hypothetical protein
MFHIIGRRSGRRLIRERKPPVHFT